MLTVVETFWLEWQAKQGDQATAAEARAWLTAMDSPTPSTGQTPDETTLARLREQVLTQMPAPTLQELLDSAVRDNRHVGGVAETAQRLFDATRPVHRLRPAARRQLTNAALLHHLAAPAGADSAAALAAIPLADLSVREQAGLVTLLRACTSPPTKRTPSPSPAPNPEVAVLCALLQLADALDYDQDQATRLESATLAPPALVLRVRGLGAPATAQRVRLCRAVIKQALALNLRVTVAPPTLDELKPLLTRPVLPQMSVTLAVQRATAGALLSWQAALELALTGDVNSLVNAERETAHLRQLLAVFRPLLKRKATHGLRRRLGHLQVRLRAAASARTITAATLAHAGKLHAQASAQMQPLLDALDQAVRKTFTEAETWLQSEGAVKLCDGLLALVGAVPLRPGPDLTLRQMAPTLLKSAVETIKTRRAEYKEGDERREHRLVGALVRGQATLEVLGGATVMGPAGESLAADWHRLEQQTEAMRHLEVLDQAVSSFLDDWALRQAKRKAPQLSGADSVLDYRHRRRADRQVRRREMARGWKAVQGRSLATRFTEILAVFKPGN